MELKKSQDEEGSTSSSAAALSETLGSKGDTLTLATLGYKQELRRNFSGFEVFGFAFSIIGLVPSIASTLSFSIPAGPVGMVWGWFIACMFIFIVGLAMAELGSAMPTAGGLYWWTHHFASPRWRNPLSFLVGYSNTIGVIGGICSIDYGFSLMFMSVIVIATDGKWEPSNGIAYCIFMACVITHAILASTLSKIMGKLQTVFVAANIILVTVTIVALPIGRGSARNSASYIFTHSENLTTWPTGFAFVLAWLSPIWSIAGFDSCVHISEEASNAPRAVPYGILSAIGAGWVLGWIVIIVIAACMTPDVLSLLETPFGQPMAQIYYDALGKKGALGMMTLLFTVQYFMGLSIMVSASRQSWAFSRDGALPFSGFFRVISQRFGYIPLRAVWGCAISALVVGLLPLIDAAAAVALFSVGIVGVYLACLLPILSRVMWGQEKFKPGPFHTGRLSVPIAWTAVVYLVFGIILALFPTTGPKTDAKSMNYAVVINGAVWTGCLVYFALDARKWYNGPKITVSQVDSSSAAVHKEEKDNVVVDTKI